MNQKGSGLIQVLLLVIIIGFLLNSYYSISFPRIKSIENFEIKGLKIDHEGF